MRCYILDKILFTCGCNFNPLISLCTLINIELSRMNLIPILPQDFPLITESNINSIISRMVTIILKEKQNKVCGLS